MTVKKVVTIKTIVANINICIPYCESYAIYYSRRIIKMILSHYTYIMIVIIEMIRDGASIKFNHLYHDFLKL